VLLSWVPLTAAGLAVSGSTDGTVQFKSGSSLGATNSLFFSPSLLGLRVSGFPGGETPSGADAALKVEQTTGSFNGSVSGTNDCCKRKYWFCWRFIKPSSQCCFEI